MAMDSLEPEPPEYVPVAVRLKSIFEQVDKVKAILRDAHGRGLDPEDKLAVAELARVFAELTDAARAILTR